MNPILASTTPEDLMKALGHDLMPVLKAQGYAAVREVVTEANRLGVTADDLPYAFWALATQKGLPDMGARQRVFTLMIDIMARTGTMPAYQKAIKVTDSETLDYTVDKLADHMATWAARSLLPFLMANYVRILNKHADKVPQATGGQVPVSNGVAYLNNAFREILTLRSAWFDDGELLRRAVRFIPEW